jgi:hypothetical protein
MGRHAPPGLTPVHTYSGEMIVREIEEREKTDGHRQPAYGTYTE